MKSEKRHELEQNELADWLGEQIQAIKPHAGIIAFAVIGGLLAIGLAIYVWGTGDSASASAWSSYFVAFNDRDPTIALDMVIKDKPDSTASLWALQSVGDINASRGAMQLFSDREEAKKSLERAEAAYKQVVAKAIKDPLLMSRARYGLAKVYESQSKVSEAKELYELVAKTDKDSALGKLAEREAKRLADPREADMLAWFAQQKPRRPAATSGRGGLPGLPNDLPERPDLSLPGLGTGTGTQSGASKGTGLDLEGLGTGKPAESPLEFPKPGETKSPAETKPPAESKPGEKSAEGAKPAKKPAESKPE